MADKGAYTLCEWLVRCDNKTVLYDFTEISLFLMKDEDSSGDQLKIPWGHRQPVNITRRLRFFSSYSESKSSVV